MPSETFRRHWLSSAQIRFSNPTLVRRTSISAAVNVGYKYPTYENLNLKKGRLKNLSDGIVFNHNRLM